MKRGWIGLGFLLALLVCGILLSATMDRKHSPVAEDLTDASRLAMEGNWELAAEKAAAAKEKWEKTWHFSAAFADHEPMEEIDGLFARVEVYADARETALFAAVCADLSRRLEAMGEAHAPAWWNLL